MVSFAQLCRDIAVLAQSAAADDLPGKGSRWEQAIASYCAARCVPTEWLPGGYRVCGFAPLSSLAHQVDTTMSCSDALVICEWKAHRGIIPKNELIRFKAVTDDFFMGFGRHVPKRPIMRLFGGPGRHTNATRLYAALHGIVLVEPTRWSPPVLAAPETAWPRLPIIPYGREDRSVLRALFRPMQGVLIPQASGGYLLPAAPDRAIIEALLEVQDRWSDRLWHMITNEPGPYERLAGSLQKPRVA